MDFENVKGMGLKEANTRVEKSWFGENIAILDRHILKNLKELNVIEEIPKSISEKKILWNRKKKMTGIFKIFKNKNGWAGLSFMVQANWRNF